MLFQDAETLAISIHALHEESDKRNPVGHGQSKRFQSTLSMRRATRLAMSERVCIIYFNPRSP